MMYRKTIRNTNFNNTCATKLYKDPLDKQWHLPKSCKLAWACETEYAVKACEMMPSMPLATSSSHCAQGKQQWFFKHTALSKDKGENSHLQNTPFVEDSFQKQAANSLLLQVQSRFTFNTWSRWLYSPERKYTTQGLHNKAAFIFHL